MTGIPYKCPKCGRSFLVPREQTFSECHILCGNCKIITKPSQQNIGRAKYIQIRASDEERQRLHARAEKHGLSLSAYIRRVLFDESFRRQMNRYRGPLTRWLEARRKR